MAGGTFDKLVGKVRPGTYVNFESTRLDTIGISERGIVLLPLINHDFGPEKEFISVYASAPDACRSKLGYSIYDVHPGMLIIREALKNAKEVIVYIPRQGEKATVTVDSLKATAKYGGERGDSLKFSITESPTEGWDVTVYLDTDVLSEYEGLANIEELIAQDNEWITFSGEGSFTATAGASLAGGATGTASNSDITTFLDASEAIKWNTMAFPLEATGEEGDTTYSLYEAVKTKIKYLREDAGKKRKAVLPGFRGDYEGLINVTNSVILTDGTALTTAQVTAWVAGVDACAKNTKSNTYEKYTGAVDIVGAKSHVEAVAAINRGEFFFSYSEEGDVVVEYDINSLVTFNKPKDKTYRKNRVLRVHDTFGESITLNFPPNKYNNSPDDWDIMEGVGRAILKQFYDDGAIKNVDYDTDFLIDRSSSTGDETYVDVGLEAVDSSEKLFFTTKTR